MSFDATTSYFDDVSARAGTASVVNREVWAESTPNRCHQNCEAFAARFGGYHVVRGRFG